MLRNVRVNIGGGGGGLKFIEKTLKMALLLGFGKTPPLGKMKKLW